MPSSHMPSVRVRKPAKQRQQDGRQQRRAFFEALEDRSMMATWTSGGALDHWNGAANWGGNVPECAVAGESAVVNSYVTV